MKILAIGGNQLISGFRKLGHTVRAFLKENTVHHEDDVACDFYREPESIAPLFRKEIETFAPHVIFQGDHSGPLIHTGLETVTLPKVWYAVDSHLHQVWHKHYAVMFDHVFCAQQNQVAGLSEYQNSVSWLPLYCGEKIEWVPWEERQYDISFIGKIEDRFNPDRKTFFTSLEQNGFPVFCTTGAWAPVYQQSKIVVNHSVADDLNLRFFEATGSGALLINDELTHSMNDILIAGEDYLVYKHNDVMDCARCIKWVHANEQEAVEMAKRAYQKIITSHLEVHRAGTVLNRVEGFNKNRDSRGTGIHISHLAWTHDVTSQLTLPEHLTAFFKKQALFLAEQALNNGDTSGRSSLLLAEELLEQKRADLALTLASKFSGSVDEDVLIRGMKVRILAEIAIGNSARAGHLAASAQRRFPDDKEIAVLAAHLSGGE